MASISVTLPDGSVREIAMGTTALELAGAIGSRLARELCWLLKIVQIPIGILLPSPIVNLGI